MTIDSYSFGRIEIDGKVYTADLIILPVGILDSWWRKEGHLLTVEDLKPVIEEHPEVLVVGTGASGMMRVDAGVQEKLESMGIEVIIQKTEDACNTFNEISSSRRTAAALHLTC